MENQTRLELLNNHLNLLIEATENCDTLTGESVSSTLYFIQQQILELMKTTHSPQQSHNMTMAGRYRFLCQQLNINFEASENGRISPTNLEELEQRYYATLKQD
ncbi:hypothetical protein [Acinetobacter sp. WZC-1]|uniref:hypothetical protein n=1 Tax=Acinetobacter sp. WZC-1 TaxID=3459034 RepID=UPI00403D73E4